MPPQFIEKTPKKEERKQEVSVRKDSNTQGAGGSLAWRSAQTHRRQLELAARSSATLPWYERFELGRGTEPAARQTRSGIVALRVQVPQPHPPDLRVAAKRSLCWIVEACAQAHVSTCVLT